MTIHHILCPVDFSDTSAHAVDQAVLLARWFNARITALHVDTAVDSSIDRLAYPVVPAFMREPAELQRLQDRLATFCQAAAAAGVTLAPRVVSGHAVQAILDEAKALPADLIVMGTHGRRGLSHVVGGSVTEAVLRLGQCPVLAVRTPKFSADHRRIISTTQ
jgi:nucleotide-binding universal stress UspA family protein